MELEILLKYLNRASIIPIGKDKKALVQWEEFQIKKPTKEEVEKWNKEWPEANWAIITGRLSNLVVVDVEKGGSVKGLPDTLIAKTGNGGFHYYYQYQEGIKNSARILPLTDIRGEGGYVLVPPSITEYEKDGKKMGGKYEWVNAGTLPSPFPKEFFGIAKASKDWKQLAVSPIQTGSRNVDMTSVIGGMLAKFVQNEWETIVWPMIVSTNKAQAEPLPERELRTSFNSIAARERQKRNIGGAIKDIVSEATEEEIKIIIELEKAKVHFKAKNIITSLHEADVLTWIEKPTGFGYEIDFHLKSTSDSNKEQWARILSKAFDHKEEKEIYPWTIITAKVVSIISTEIRNEKQDFVASEIVPKECGWLYEPFIQEGQLNTFFGLGMSGKSLLALFFAKHIIKNFGIKVLFIDYEDIDGGWRVRLDKILAHDGGGASLDDFIYFKSKQMILAEQTDKIREIIKKYNVKMVIVDSASMASGESTSDEKAAIRMISALKLLKTTVLLIAHQRKNDGDKTPMGSIQYENQSRNVWNLKSEVDGGSNSIVHIAMTHTKANNTYIRRKPIGYKCEYFDDKVVIEPEDAIKHFEGKFTIKDRIINLLKNGGMDYKAIAGELGVSPASIAKNLTKLSKGNGPVVNVGSLWVLRTNLTKRDYDIS